jgi:hypothetical protein
MSTDVSNVCAACIIRVMTRRENQSHNTPREAQGEDRMHSSYSFTSSALDAGVVSVTHRPPFTPGERTPSTHCTEGWVVPGAGLDTEVKGKILLPLLGIEPRSNLRIKL